MYETMSVEEMARRALYNSEKALAYYEIIKVWAAHAYCYRAQQQRYELETYWVKEHDDIMYAHGTAAFWGREMVTKYYAEGNEIMNEGKLKLMHDLFPDQVALTEENLGIGDLVIRYQTTPYITVADDLQTAKGVFNTLGFNTENDAAGDPVGMILTGRDAVDFIKESDGWKIWHYRDAADTGFISVDKDIFNVPMTPGGGRTVDGAFPAPNRTLYPFAEDGAFSVFRPAKFAPELPAPYAT